MAKIKCICGAQLSNVASPNETEGILLRSMDIDHRNEENALTIIDAGRGVWECHNCGRLAINFPGKDSSTVKWYYPENAIPGALMAFDKENK